MAGTRQGQPPPTGRHDSDEGKRLNASPLPARADAVAVAVDGGTDDQVPRIAASGRGAVAEQILNIAFERGIKVRQDADLAEILAKFDIDSPVPVEALAAVAEILSYVYLSNSRQAPDDSNNAPTKDETP